MNEDQNCCLLNATYQSAQMTLKALEYLRPKVKSGNLAEDIATLKAEYNDVLRSADRLSRDCGDRPKDNNIFTKAGLWTNIKMKTITDDSTQNIAQTIMIGAFMEVIELIKVLAKNPLADIESVELARRLKEINHNAISTFTPYLEKNKE